MGPLAHIAAGRAVGAPAAASVWLDAPHLLRVVAPRWAAAGQLLANQTHSWPGLLVAAVLWQRRGIVGWATHVALDTISHAPGEGSHGQHKRKVWLP